MNTKLTEEKSGYALPSPSVDGNMSVEKALSSRRSRRNFKDEELSAEQLSQVLWAAYGITSREKNPHGPSFRTVPSSAYAYDIYVIAGKVKGIQSGIYRYQPEGHKIERISEGDVRNELCKHVFGGKPMTGSAPVTLTYVTAPERMPERFGARGHERYMFLDIAHSSENVYLQVQTLGLGNCFVGYFNDKEVHELLKLPATGQILAFVPVGYYYEK